MDAKNEQISLSPQQQRFAHSGLNIYKELIAPGAGWGEFLLQEFFGLCVAPIPGLLGFGIRSLSVSWVVGECGVRPGIGHHVTLRGGHLVSFGDRVLIEDFSTLDVRSGGFIRLGDYVSLGRFSSLVCKGQGISLADGVNVGTHCRIATETSVTVGESTLIAAYCYLGPGNHRIPAQGESIMKSGMDIRGGVSIGRDVWIGTRATVLDGVTIGDGAVIGAHSLVRDDVAAGDIVVGSPARRVGSRPTIQEEGHAK